MIEILSNHAVEIAIAAGATIVVAVIGGVATEVGPWYESLRFPALRPPNWLFAPAWAVIFALIAASGVVAWDETPTQAHAGLIALYAVNGVLNAGWSPLFFKLRRPDWALLEVLPFWASVLALILYVAPYSPSAAELLAPYLAWVTFAGWLNWQMVKLNAPFPPRKD